MTEAAATDPAADQHGATDYAQTVNVINLLTDVRFKLAALVPAITGAAVALLTGSDVDWTTRTVLGIGGFAFAFGIVVYDLRNSQLYNGAIGRARALEQALGFARFGGDDMRGLFGSRSDTDDMAAVRAKNRFVGFRVNHGPALSLVYTATLAAWVWVVLGSVADGIETNWDEHRKLSQLVAGLTLAAAVVIYWQHSRHDRTDSKPVRVGVSLTEDQRRELDRVARRSGMSRQEVMHAAIAGLATASATEMQSPQSDVTSGPGEPDSQPQAYPLRLTQRERKRLSSSTNEAETVRSMVVDFLREQSNSAETSAPPE